MRRFSRNDNLLLLALTLATTVAGGILVVVIMQQARALHGHPPNLERLITFWIEHKVYINVTVSIIAIAVYAIMALASRGVDRKAFWIWTIAWAVQLTGVLCRQFFEVGSEAATPIHLLLNAASTSFVLLGVLVIRGRTRWPLLLVLAPLLACLFDSTLRFIPGAFTNFVTVIYFSLALLDRFRTVAWVPAYFTYLCYTVYAAVQVLYPLDMHFGQLAMGAGLINVDPYIQDAIQTFAYTIGAFAKLGGSLGLFLVFALAAKSGNMISKQRSV